MEVEVLIKDYKGVDGTSLSSSRCAQIIRVYEMLEELGAKVITYIDIQEESVKALSIMKVCFLLNRVSQNLEPNLYWLAGHLIIFLTRLPIRKRLCLD